MVGALITAIVDVLLNVAMGFISLFVAFVIVPTVNVLIVAAIFFSIVGIAYLCRRLYYYLRPGGDVARRALDPRLPLRPGLATTDCHRKRSVSRERHRRHARGVGRQQPQARPCGGESRRNGDREIGGFVTRQHQPEDQEPGYSRQRVKY
jgi:hypothetical protein